MAKKKGKASCTCSNPRLATMPKKPDTGASQKAVGPSSLSVTEALAGTFVATVFEFVQLDIVTPVEDATRLTPLSGPEARCTSTF